MVCMWLDHFGRSYFPFSLRIYCIWLCIYSCMSYCISFFVYFFYLHLTFMILFFRHFCKMDKKGCFYSEEIIVCKTCLVTVSILNLILHHLTCYSPDRGHSILSSHMICCLAHILITFCYSYSKYVSGYA
jgi:hypothetical protein